MKKRRYYRQGLIAERVARVFLLLKGYRILEERLKTPVGEIDLLVRKGRTLVIVEVKRRPSWEEGYYALRPVQQMRLRRAAEFVLTRTPGYANLNVRFDLIVMNQCLLPKHITHILMAGF